MSPTTKGIVVVCAGFCLSLSLGSLFMWFPIAVELLRPLADGGSYGWTVRQVSVPFAVGAASFVLAMIGGGRIQDRLGPRWPATIGGVFIGLGTILASMSSDRLGDPRVLSAFMVLGLGLMVGSGAGLTFSSLIPPAVKWIVKRHNGLAAGVVTAGFAMGPAWVNVRILSIVETYGVSSVLLAQGIVLLAVIVGLSQLLENPLVGYVAPGTYLDAEGPLAGPLPWAGLTPRRTISTLAFRALWTSGAILAATSALLSVRLTVALMQDPPGGALLVAGFALSGSLGGVAAGALHDRFGTLGLSGVFAVVAVTLGLAVLLSALGHIAPAVFFSAASGVGSVVVAWVATMECFGTRNSGGNFGLVFSGWALGMLLGALLAISSVGRDLGMTGRGSAQIPALIGLALLLVSAVVLATKVRRPPPTGGDPTCGSGHVAT